MTGYQSKKAAAQDKLAQPAQEREALQLALDVLEDLPGFRADIDNAITAIKEALAQPAQEPVAWKETDEVECPVCKDKGFPWPKCGHITYLESTPQQRPWVGLTDKEKKEIYRLSVYVEGAISLTEAKLKEKNA